MTDLSALVGWPPVAIGLTVSIWAGRSMRGPRHGGKIFVTGLLAALLGLLLTFATAAIHTLCVESLRLCKSYGDGNMSYWLHSLVAVPLFWVGMLAFGEDRAELLLVEARRRSDSVVQALNQFRRREPVVESCPNCGTKLSVEELLRGVSSRTVQVRCSCGQCDGKYEVSDRAT